MLLAIDVGNTNIVFGVYEGKELSYYWRISTNRTQASDEYALTIRQLFDHHDVAVSAIEAVIISSVVPPIMYSLEHAIRKCFGIKPMVVGPGIKTGMNNRYDNPAQLGTDRLVNAVAAYELYGGPVIIVDCGTATKFCAVNRRGEYLGGMICPGIKISSEALFQSAAQLRAVEYVKPSSVIGKNTTQALQSGIIFGFAEMVNYLVRRMAAELGESGVTVVATGGLARMIADEAEVISLINEHLTLEGLRVLYDKNKRPQHG